MTGALNKYKSPLTTWKAMGDEVSALWPDAMLTIPVNGKTNGPPCLWRPHAVILVSITRHFAPYTADL
jgi:hypothetical protein